MSRSDSIAALAASLAKAQAVIEGAKKDSVNPHFRSRYADLASVWDACRKPLTDHGLSVMQLPGKDEGGYYLITVLAHSSGEWIESKLAFVPVKDDPQGLGSALTYARRYALAAMVGVAPEEDDGEAAMGRAAVAAPPARAATPPARPLNAVQAAVRATVKPPKEDTSDIPF